MECLVHLHNAVNLPNKPIAGEEADTSCEQEEAEDHDAGVAKVEEGGGRPLNVQLGQEIVHTVAGQVEGREAAGQEAAPPPVVVLSTQVKVAEEDGSLWASNNQNQVHQEQKPVHVVYLGWPDGVENKEELNEDTTEGQDSSHDDAGNRLVVNALVGDLSWNLVCSHRLFNHWFSKSEICSHKGERYADAEPEREQSH